MNRSHAGALLLRAAGAFAVVSTLTGGLVVSCAGDPTGGTGGGASSAPASASMGRWNPTARDTCSKAFHDSFFVIGPDGKKYPTWHRPEETDPATNTVCSFGHDHGSDPTGSAIWSALQAHFAFDANHNGLLDASELAASGIPFGLASERLVGSSTPRLEEHTGYKILFANGAPRTIVTGAASQGFDLRCDLFAAYNQAAASADAFASNLFSVTYAIDCNNGASVGLYPVKVIVSTMGVYGTPGGFTLDTSNAQLTTGDPDPLTSPSGGDELGRRVPERAAVFAGIFVASGQTSDFSKLFERWDTKLRLKRGNGTELATLVPAFRLDDPARYYDSGLARSINLCYFGLDANNNLVTDPALAASITKQVRNNASCQLLAPNGPATPIGQRVAFDDPASRFKGCTSTAFFGADALRNAGSVTIWYTDAFGGNANTVAFANSIKQYIAATDTGAIVLGEANASRSGCAGNLVHVPN